MPNRLMIFVDDDEESAVREFLQIYRQDKKILQEIKDEAITQDG